MQLEWMGRYRGVLEKLIKYCNVYAQCFNKEINRIDDVSFSFAQIQVVEYLIENEELAQNMTMIASRLGIKQSQFSKLVSKLVSKGMLERYHAEGNRKSVIILVSDFGKRIYAKYSQQILNRHFAMMFEQAKDLGQDEIDAFERFLGAPYANKAQNQCKRLIKL